MAAFTYPRRSNTHPQSRQPAKSGRCALLTTRLGTGIRAPGPTCSKPLSKKALRRGRNGRCIKPVRWWTLDRNSAASGRQTYNGINQCPHNATAIKCGGARWTALVARRATQYSGHVIQSVRHKGLQRLYESSSAAGIHPEHAMRLRMLLVALEGATNIGDMNVPGFELRPVRPKTGKRRWSVWVAGNWRVTFEFSHRHAYLVDYEEHAEISAETERRSRAAAAVRARALESAGHIELARAFRTYASGRTDGHA
jgi:toxin HigB-1